MSATSGTWISPPSPRTSTGISAARSAPSIVAICERLRTRTAKVERFSAGFAKRALSNQSDVKYSAIAVASRSRFSKTPQTSSPSPASGRGVSGGTSAPLSRRIFSETTFASSRIVLSFRKVVSSE